MRVVSWVVTMVVAVGLCDSLTHGPLVLPWEPMRPSEFDRGRKRLSPSPPSEPCVRFSRTRLSSQ